MVSRRLWMVLMLIFLVPAFSGCGNLLDNRLKGTVDLDNGDISLPGLRGQAVIRRDDLGVPVVEAGNLPDLALALGHVMASDRLAQMVALSLLGQGRLSEMAGPLALEMDIYIRTLGVAKAARAEYDALPPERRAVLAAFAEGVNAYIKSHEHKLPLDFRLSGYAPPPWEPVNSLYIAHVFNLGLSFNLHQEIAFLSIAQAVGPRKAAWLMPIHGDEPLPFEAAGALSGLDWGALGKAAANFQEARLEINRMLGPTGIAASNNWAVAPQNTLQNAAIIANDTHLPLEQPSLWMLVHMKCPELEAAGVAIPGVPAIAAGYNGHIAWGVTMVMGDNQDVFIEQVKDIDGRPHYLHKGRWLPVETRRETFKVKGRPDETRVVGATVHGPLIDAVLAADPKHIMQPPAVTFRYGLSAATVISQPGRSIDGVFALMKARDMKSAHQAIRGIRSLSLNYVYGNADHIAWQVSGCYPLRKSGRGQLPSPGWTGECDWEGVVAANDLPYVLDPPEGYLYTANNRTVPPGKGPLLSSTWCAPERAERIGQLLSAQDRHTFRDSARMHQDQVDLAAKKWLALLFEPAFSAEVIRAVHGWKDAEKRNNALEALDILKGWDGNMGPDSAPAAVMGLFHQVFIHRVFADELKPGSPAWKGFITAIQALYAADQDHLLGRPDSPFWDDVSTPHTETKAETIAACLCDTIAMAEDRMGRARSRWRWGRLLTYSWETQTTRMRRYLPVLERLGAGIIARYTDRGPFGAGGSYETVNVAGFMKGEDFKVWLVPAMRMIVDFGLEEPMFLVNCGGQSGNPASPHYDDGIPVWLEGQMRPMPFGPATVARQYHRVLTLNPL